MDKLVGILIFLRLQEKAVDLLPLKNIHHDLFRRASRPMGDEFMASGRWIPAKVPVQVWKVPAKLFDRSIDLGVIMDIHSHKLLVLPG